jgi:hypothetical protein
MTWDEPSTIPGLRDSGQINLEFPLHRAYRRDHLRAARGVTVAALLGVAIILAVWGMAIWLMH